MIKIEGTRFFGLDIEFGDDDLVLINFMVDPEMIELKSYRRTPFSSVMIKSSELKSKLVDRKLISSRSEEKEIVVEYIETASVDYRTYEFNSYKDAEYSELAASIKNEDISLHTIIYYIDTTEKPNKYDEESVLIAATSFSGMLAPIPKSVNYDLYNGALINCKPFESNGSWSQKIVYTLANIKTDFLIYEFQKIDDVHGIMYERCWTRTMKSDRVFISYYEIKFDILIPGREEFFKKSSKNVFHLSDIPQDIMKGSDMIVKM